MICLSKVITNAKMANILPHFPVAFNQSGIISYLSKRIVPYTPQPLVANDRRDLNRLQR